MKMMSVSSFSRVEACRQPWADDGRGVFESRMGDGLRAASSGMVGRVLAAGDAGDAGLLEWIEAWGTAAVIDGRCGSVTIDGSDVVVCAGMRRATLSRIDATTPARGVTDRGLADLAIVILRDGDVPTVRVAVSKGRLDHDPAVWAIRLTPSIPVEHDIEGAVARLGPASIKRTIPRAGSPAGRQ